MKKQTNQNKLSENAENNDVVATPDSNDFHREFTINPLLHDLFFDVASN